MGSGAASSAHLGALWHAQPCPWPAARWEPSRLVVPVSSAPKAMPRFYPARPVEMVPWWNCCTVSRWPRCRAVALEGASLMQTQQEKVREDSLVHLPLY